MSDEGDSDRDYGGLGYGVTRAARQPGAADPRLGEAGDRRRRHQPRCAAPPATPSKLSAHKCQPELRRRAKQAHYARATPINAAARADYPLTAGAASTTQAGRRPRDAEPHTHAGARVQARTVMRGRGGATDAGDVDEGVAGHGAHRRQPQQALRHCRAGKSTRISETRLGKPTRKGRSYADAERPAL